MAGLASPLGVELFDCAADAEAPGELAKPFVLFGNDVALHGFFHRHAGLVQFFRLAGDVVKYLALEFYNFLAAELTVTRDKNRAFVEFPELRRGGAPRGRIPIDVGHILTVYE